MGLAPAGGGIRQFSRDGPIPGSRGGGAQRNRGGILGIGAGLWRSGGRRVKGAGLTGQRNKRPVKKETKGGHSSSRAPAALKAVSLRNLKELHDYLMVNKWLWTPGRCRHTEAPSSGARGGRKQRAHHGQRKCRSVHSSSASSQHIYLKHRRLQKPPNAFLLCANNSWLKPGKERTHALLEFSRRKHLPSLAPTYITNQVAKKLTHIQFRQPICIHTGPLNTCLDYHPHPPKTRCCS